VTQLLAEIPGISPLFQILLNAMGWALAKIYDVIPNYGVAIILLTLLIRLVLLPLGIKQIKSMQSMQAIQPKVKELQKKYKGNKTKIQEETMNLYREFGVNPLGGCLPLLLTFPFLIAMYAVIRAPQLVPTTANSQKVYEIHNNHLPEESTLFRNVVTHQGTGFGWMDLQCSAAEAGTAASIVDSQGKPVVAGAPILSDTGSALPFEASTKPTLDCGSGGWTAKISYIIFLLAMVGTTFYQQRQMQQVSPPGATSQQQQAIMKVMPIMFGFFGFRFASGLLVYWITSNILQIGQQYGLLKLGHIGPDALERRAAQAPTKKPAKQGYLAGLMAKAEDERKKRETETRPGTSKGSAGTKRNPSSGKPRTQGTGSKGTGSKGSGSEGQKKRPPGTSGTTPKKKNPGGSGGTGS
jgi:YidC/Oxa1 family membrane protein insertase